METRDATGKAKVGLLRVSKRIYITFEFPDEYEAMRFFDVWSMGEIDVHYKGPIELVEKNDQ